MSQPIQIFLEADKEYHYCTCGKGKDGILCDGSHKGSKFTPIAFSIKQSKDYYLHPCKKSVNEAFCDSAHEE